MGFIKPLNSQSRLCYPRIPTLHHRFKTLNLQLKTLKNDLAFDRRRRKHKTTFLCAQILIFMNFFSLLLKPTLKSLLRTWSDLYRAFARCAALVATAEENLCCEELCAKIISGLEGEAPVVSIKYLI